MICSFRLDSFAFLPPLVATLRSWEDGKISGMKGKGLAEQKGRFFLSYWQRLKSRLNPGLSCVEHGLEGVSTPYQPYLGARTTLWIAPGVITAKKSLPATLRYEGRTQMAVFSFIP